MKVRVMIVAVSCVVVFAAAASRAQVIIRGTESSDQSTSSSRVNIITSDRQVVPLIKETRKAETADGAQRTESITRLRLNDGDYFDWRQNTTVKKEVAPGITEISNDVVQRDRQGGEQTTERSLETVVKTDSGEKSQTKVYTPNSSGGLVLDHVVDATTVRGADGEAETTRNEQVADVNGNLVLKKQADEVTTEVGPNETVTTTKMRSANHLTGQLAVTEESTTSTRTDGATKQIETVVRKPGRTGWEVTGRTTTTETAAPDGSVNRETVESGRSLYSTYTGNQMLEPLVPERKVIERETRQPDGTVVVQRDVFRRDVNGDWKPETFSTNQPSIGMGERTSPPARTEPQATPEGAEPPPSPAEGQ
ncbi:MAG TPA: hypothetical protein VL486_11030 [Verrucomicrobiae bacterium]|nr:hypothetical protein [Verrucomicrobiae bacterium]